MNTPENYDDVIINTLRSQGVTGEMHRTTLSFSFIFSNPILDIYMSFRHVSCVIKGKMYLSNEINCFINMTFVCHS